MRAKKAPAQLRLNPASPLAESELQPGPLRKGAFFIAPTLFSDNSIVPTVLLFREKILYLEWGCDSLGGLERQKRLKRPQLNV